MSIIATPGQLAEYLEAKATTAREYVRTSTKPRSEFTLKQAGRAEAFDIAATLIGALTPPTKKRRARGLP